MSARGLAGGGVHLVDLVLAVLVIEAIVLMLHDRRTGQGIASRDCLGLLGAGLFLALALRCALSGAWLGWIALSLLLALLAHLDDLRRRWRPPPVCTGRNSETSSS